MFNYHEYAIRLEIIREINHTTKVDFAKEIGISYHTYLKVMDMTIIYPLQYKVLLRVKAFLDKQQ